MTALSQTPSPLSKVQRWRPWRAGSVAGGPARVGWWRGLLLAACLAGWDTGGTGRAAGAGPAVLAQAHSHNDYLRGRPLLDALEQGFGSVEADIHLVKGALLVAHDPGEVKDGRTLEALYLKPLADRIRERGGVVQPGLATFHLLIDLKTEATATYAALRPVLERHAAHLTRFSDRGIQTGAITVVLSGNRPTAVVAAEPGRLCGIDGRLADLTNGPAATLMPLVSESWRTAFTWNGQGGMPAEEQARLRDLVERAHAQGRRIRFWGAADRREMWAAQRAAGVDLINTDRLGALREFLGEGR